MSRAIVCLVTLGCAALAGAQQPPARDTSAVPAAAAGSAVVRGRVTETGTGRPVRNAFVHVTVNDPVRVDKTAYTDASGRYQIDGLPPGTYSVSAIKTNYAPAFFGVQRNVGPSKPLELRAGQTVERIDLMMTRSGAIAGRILDEYGDPAVDVSVMPMRAAFSNGERVWQPSGSSASTNDLGEYRLFGLRPGQYVVSATLRTNFGGPFDSPDAPQTAYEPTYYPGTGNPAAAQRLTVAAGQTVTGISLTLMPVASARVSGTAFDSRGRPMTSGSVMLAPLHVGVGAQILGGSIRPDGSFTISGVVPGEYTLRTGGPSSRTEYSMLDITVGGGDLSGIQLLSAKISTVRGRVTFDDSPSPRPSIEAIRLNVAHRRSGPVAGAPATAKSDGTFEVTTMGGPGFLQVSGAGDWRAKRILVRGVDILDSGVDVPVNGDVNDVVVELTTKHTDLTARVVDDAGGGITGPMTVVIFSPDSERWAMPTRYFFAGPLGANGVAHVRTLPQGSYLAVAFPNEEPMLNLFTDPDVLGQLRDRALAFTLGDEDVKTIEIKAGPPPIY